MIPKVQSSRPQVYSWSRERWRPARPGDNLSVLAWPLLCVLWADIRSCQNDVRWTTRCFSLFQWVLALSTSIKIQPLIIGPIPLGQGEMDTDRVLTSSTLIRSTLASPLIRVCRPPLCKLFGGTIMQYIMWTTSLLRCTTIQRPIRSRQV